MHPTDRNARIAGLLYLVMAAPAVFGLMVVPRALIVPGNATATADNVLGHEMFFRTGIVASLVASVLFILLAMALHRLLADVNRRQAALMVALVGVAVAIAFLNEVNSIAALTLFRGGDFLAVFDKPQADALGMLFLRLHYQGHVVGEIFWGLWLVPFGLLVMRSGFLPRLLGVLLVVNCFAYVVASLTALLAPDYTPVVSRAVMPALMGELWILLWLLFKGANVDALERQPAAAA